MVAIQHIIYTISIYAYRALLAIVSPFVKKAKLWIDGRKDIISKIETELRNNTSPIVWFHAASLGEFEQARPVIESFKNKYPSHKVFLTFFSPSGYEVKKNYDHADYIFYLPLDTKSNAEQFIKLVQPKMALFVKYEFWHNYISVCKDNNIPMISFSTILRPSQHFFKWHGKFYRNILNNITEFFVQNEETKHLLKSINIESTLAGDTRCDRVLQIASETKDFPIIESFAKDNKVIIIGSAWPQDMELFIPFINKYPEYKYIIAPHEINVSHINSEIKSIKPKSVLYSELTGDSKAKVLYIDCIGILSQIYKYATVTYVGGAFGSGLHNVLEPATFYKPVLFGKKYDKFQEAKDLIKLGGAYSIENAKELETELQHLLTDNVYLKRKSDICGQYVRDQSGASDKIIEYIESLI